VGQISKVRIGVITAFLLLSGAFIYWQPSSGRIEKEVRLNQALSNINDWKLIGESPLQKEVVTSLKLDDYAFCSFSKGRERVQLYIGYYLTAKKVGAAHDPLVCFPGQGWVLSDKSKGELKLDKSGETCVSYSSMIAQRGVDKELIVYWFQSHDKTSANTFDQKLRSLAAKLFSGREDNAFVRVSMTLGDRSLAEGRSAVFGFIRDFYPAFLGYVKASSSGSESKEPRP
jgi:EpsI family protein